LILRATFLLIFCVGLFPSVQAQECQTDSCKYKRELQSIRKLEANFPDSAIAAYQLFIENSKGKNAITYEIDAHYRLGRMHQNSGKFPIALQHFVTVLNRGKSTDNPRTKASAHNAMGMTFRQQGHYVDAIPHFEAALEIFRKINHRKGIAVALNNMAILYKVQRQYDRAIQLYHEAFNIHLSRKDSVGMINTSMNLGLAKMRISEKDSSFFFVRRALHLSKVCNFPKRMGYAYAALIDVFLETNQLDSVAHYLPLSDQYTDETEMPRVIGRYLHHSTYNMKIAAHKVSISWAEKGLRIADSLGLSEHKKSALELLFRAHRKLGNDSKALEYFLVATALTDSLQNLEAKRELQLITDSYEWEKQEKKLAETHLEKANEKTKRLKAERSYQKEEALNQTLLWGSMLTIIIALIILLFYRKLQRQKKTIQDALQEKEVLLGEIHHRVKNNLQLISSILELQLRSIDDEEAIQALRESQNKVNAVSLIHQKLYQTEHFHQINTVDYITDMVPALIDTFAHGILVVQPQLNISPANIALDQAIPMGLILTELLNNAFKHGFVNQTNGILEIEFETKADEHILSVRNDGNKLEQSGNGFGLKMIQSLTRQLKGNFEISDQNGTLAQLRFPKI
jgi:two-component sensor histidine kinase